MPPTPNRPPSANGGGMATPTGSAVRPPVPGKTSMSAILSNVDALFITARKGNLNNNSMIYLRTAIREHYRFIIFHAIKSGKANPLLDTPTDIDPSIATPGHPALIDPVTWGTMVAAAELEARKRMADGTLIAPNFPSAPASNGAPTPGSSPGSSVAGSSGGVRPPPQSAASRQAHQRVVAGSATPSMLGSISGVSSPAGSVTSQMRNMLPGTLMKGDELRRWASMPSAERAEAMRNEPELKRRFEASVQWYRAQSKAKELANQNAAVQGGASGQVKTEPSAGGTGQQSNGGPSTTNPAGTAGNPNGSNIPILGNPNFTLSQPPSRHPAPAPQQSSANNNGQGGSGAPAGINQARNLDPSLSTYPSPAHIQNQNAVPPALVRRVVEEPEGERRKRKYREWVREQGAGMEVELGLEEILNDVVEKFITDVTRGGAKLARHRKSDKVEVKDLAFYIDKQYHLTVPGFDAVLPQRNHIPPDDDERKRLRAVIPRTVLSRAVEGTGATKETANPGEAT